MDCFHVNEKRDGPLLFFSNSTKKEKNGLLLLLLLPHEEKDYKFCIKDMIVSFAFTWDQGFVSHMKVWNIGSYCSCYRLMGKQEQCEDDNVKIWQHVDSSLSGSIATTIACTSSQYPTSKQHYLHCPSSTIPSSLLENLGMPGKWNGEKTNQEWAQHIGIS